MPSGPKKRKTAKKNMAANANSEGNDEIRSQDEKASDSCDSPSSFNNHNHGITVDVEDDESENIYIAPSASQHPAVVESQSMEKKGTPESEREHHGDLKEKSSPSNGSEIPKSFENQPLVASAPRAMQKTSFLSCCGLFDAVSSWDR